MQAVIQAGGKGTRLRPYTTVLPKPLMPVGAKPVIELLLKWLRRNDVTEAFVTTGYLGHLIRSVCGDGRQWGMQIHYTAELEPLGTVGSLDLLRDRLRGPFFVLNGDVLTDLNLGRLSREPSRPWRPADHRDDTADDSYRLRRDRGRCRARVRFREKPNLKQIVSMGVYCMEPCVIDHIPNGVAFGFDDLMACLLAKNVPVHVFLHQGQWLDIGRIEDFQRAQELGWEDVPLHPSELLTSEAAD